MQKLGDLLGRFTKLAQTSDDAKGAVVEALRRVGVKIKDISDIAIHKNTVTVKLSPPQKSEVFLKQAKIISILSENPLTKHITLVR